MRTKILLLSLGLLEVCACPGWASHEGAMRVSHLFQSAGLEEGRDQALEALQKA